jgi:hypothetical protein
VQVDLSGGDPENPSGTVSMTNTKSGHTGVWQVSGQWQDSELVLTPGAWVQRPNASWVPDLIRVTPTGDSDLNGTLANPDTPSDVTGHIVVSR